MAKKISNSERRQQDQLRRKGLKVGAVYDAKLVKARREEIRRVLGLALDYDDPEAIEMMIGRIDESAYLGDWYEGLYVNAGVPMAKTTARSLAGAAAADDSMWMSTMRRYARERAASQITIVSGTLKDSLVDLTRKVLEAEIGWGVEKITKQIYREYQDTLEKWMCRRIAQTETMISLGKSADMAARTLDIGFTKQWCISGLGNTRDSHEQMDGIEVDMDEMFILPGGDMMYYPHDTSMNPSAGEIINCACTCIRRPK